jgi:hypothetical protein
MLEDKVKKHIRYWLRTKFVWGKTDCSMVLGDYLFDVTGIDCVVHRRGKYSTRKELEELTGWSKDPIAVMEECIARIPLQRTDKLKYGDICLLELKDNLYVGGLIFFNNVVVKTLRGVSIAPIHSIKMVAAWAV